jgi:hypothetical protein
MAIKSIIALAAAAVVSTFTLPTSDANARHFGGGFRSGGFHGGFHGGGFRFGGFRGGFFPRVGFYGGPYYAAYGGCWRYVPGYYGPRRIWACGPYGYGYRGYYPY